MLLPLIAVVGGGALTSPASASAACWNGSAVVRGNAWYLAPNFGAHIATRSFGYGASGDVPFFGHWDGRSVNSAPGVVRGRMWYLRRTQTSGPAEISFAYGLATDTPVVGDWNGDGIDTPGVVRGHTWYLRNSNTPGPAEISFTFNEPGIPVVLRAGPNYPATFDNGTWYVRNSLTTGPATSVGHFGQAGDIPLGNGYFMATPDCTSPTLGLVRGNVWHLKGNDGYVSEYSYSFGRPGDKFLSQHY